MLSKGQLCWLWMFCEHIIILQALYLYYKYPNPNPNPNRSTIQSASYLYRIPWPWRCLMLHACIQFSSFEICLIMLTPSHCEWNINKIGSHTYNLSNFHSSLINIYKRTFIYLLRLLAYRLQSQCKKHLFSKTIHWDEYLNHSKTSTIYRTLLGLITTRSPKLSLKVPSVVSTNLTPVTPAVFLLFSFKWFCLFFHGQPWLFCVHGLTRCRHIAVT